MNGTLRSIFLLSLVLLGLSPALAQDGGWPRTVDLDGGTVTIYEPQVDEMSDDFVRFRAALAYREKPGDEPVFGAGWFESGLQVDRSSGTAHPVGLKVSQTRFPVEADVQTRLSEAMAQPGFASNFVFSLDELEASRKMVQAEADAAGSISTDPPRIMYRDKPALLVSIDGDPVLRPIEDSGFEAVINTPYPLISDGRQYWLNVADGVWYRADRATGPFRFTETVPLAIEGLVKSDEQAAGDDESRARLALTEKVTAANAPEIVVSTEPAELVVTDGPAAFVPLVDDLLVLNNSDDDVFMHLGEQAYYIVLAGRWYRAKSLAGPWSYRDAEELPADFANIPRTSEQADSRVHVAGTEESEEAVLDAQVPQTAAVKRGEADVEVQYDGDPVFEEVDGTDMLYVANTGSTVILSGGLYYLVEDGVWYVSTSHNGPWQVAVARPDQVRVILPSSPVYNVKYVYVYGHTPDVVYVGYTPGYMGSYVYHNTVFYGTGWYYRPWVTPHWYYPHHSTWGFHVRYDPWYGWNFGLAWAWGPFSFSYWPGGYWHHHHHWHHRHYSYWGPHGYRPRHHHHRPPHHRPPGYHPPGHRPPGHGGGNRPHPYERHHNLYRDEGQRALIADTRDKPPNSWDRRKNEGGSAGKAWAKSGGGRKVANKEKTYYAMTKPVSRTDLATKARTGEQRYKASRNKVVTPARNKSYASLPVKPVQKANRKATAGLKAKDAVRKQAPTRNVAPKAKDVVVRKQATTKKAAPSTVKAKHVVKASSGKRTVTPGKRSYANASRTVTKKAPVQARSYSRPNKMPVVKLTRPAKQPAPAYGGSRGKSQPVMRAPKPQPQKQYNRQSAPAPKAAPPPKQGKAVTRSKNKQTRVK